MSDDLDLLTVLLHNGEVLAENKDRDRIYCGLVAGRPWLYPGEAVIRHAGKLYIVTMPNVEEVKPSK